MLEMRELNERQKAEHTERMYERMKDDLDDIQRRNMELESKFSQVATEFN